MSAGDFVELGFATVDTDRARRCGFPEVIFCEHKTPEEVVSIAQVLFNHGAAVLMTRALPPHFEAVQAAFPEATAHLRARCLTIEPTPLPRLPGRVGIVCAGTSDLAVAEECAVTLEMLGGTTFRVTDVGVAGVQRLIARRDDLESCEVLIVIAGMEGALPSAVAGLITKPVIAVPTSVGYGASFGGLAALLGMLNSCGSGVTVVNIDNGFGAAHAAAKILRLLLPATPD